MTTLDLWAIARYDLGQTDEQFGRLTPWMFDLLLARWQAEEKKEFIRAGMVAAAVINFSSCHPDTPVSMMDFVPGGKEEEDLSKLSPEAQASKIITAFGKKEYVKR